LNPIGLTNVIGKHQKQKYLNTNQTSKTMFHYKEVALWMVLGMLFTPMAFLLMPLVAALAISGGLLLFLVRSFKNTHFMRHY
jgi:hypothetical protein